MAVVAFFVLGPVAVSAPRPERGTVMIMQHVCRSPAIRADSDLVSLEQQGGGGNVAAAVKRIMACPVVSLPSHGPGEGITGRPVRFDYQVTGADGTIQTLADAKHAAAKLCELDVALDADGDGRWSDDVCLDNSHYVFQNVALGKVTVEQIVSPGGTRFGTLRFTPVELDRNNDADSLETYVSGRITLDTAADRNASVMLHIYNFRVPRPREPATRDTSTETKQGGSGPVSLAPLLLSLAAGAGAALNARRRFQNRNQDEGGQLCNDGGQPSQLPVGLAETPPSPTR